METISINGYDYCTVANATSLCCECCESGEKLSKEDIKEKILDNKDIKIQDSTDVIAYLKTKEKLTNGSVVMSKEISLNISEDPKEMKHMWEKVDSISHATISCTSICSSNIREYKEILDIFNVDYNFYKVKTNIDFISYVSDTEIITNEISVLEKIENIGNKITFTIEDIFKDETKNEYKLLVQLHSELLNKKTKCFNVTSPELDEESIVNCIKKELDLMKKMIDFKENTTGEIQRI